MTSFLPPLLVVSRAVPTQPGTASLYGPTGAYQGRIVRQADAPDMASVYDARGRYAGRLVTRGDGRREVFDAAGRSLALLLPEQPLEGPWT